MATAGTAYRCAAILGSVDRISGARFPLRTGFRCQFACRKMGDSDAVLFQCASLLKVPRRAEYGERQVSLLTLFPGYGDVIFNQYQHMQNLDMFKNRKICTYSLDVSI